MKTVKKMKQFTVNLIQRIYVPLTVVAEDEDEALELARDSMSGSFESYSNGSCGFSEPYDDWEDEDGTPKVEMSEYIEEWDEMEFEIDQYEKVIPVELTFDDGEDEEDEDDFDD